MSIDWRVLSKFNPSLAAAGAAAASRTARTARGRKAACKGEGCGSSCGTSTERRRASNPNERHFDRFISGAAQYNSWHTAEDQLDDDSSDLLAEPLLDDDDNTRSTLSPRTALSNTVMTYASSAGEHWMMDCTEVRADLDAHMQTLSDLIDAALECAVNHQNESGACEAEYQAVLDEQKAIDDAQAREAQVCPPLIG
jgi:hypothetical protein